MIFKSSNQNCDLLTLTSESDLVTLKLVHIIVRGMGNLSTNFADSGTFVFDL